LQKTHDGFLQDALAGLKGPRKTLPCKYFYDAAGSQLFDLICETPEYYPTRTELALLRESLDEIAFLAGPGADVVELGSCNSSKGRLLLKGLHAPRSYIPVDVSAAALRTAAREMQEAFPTVKVRPLAADFTAIEALPISQGDGGRVLFYFAGSTIGNFEPEAAVRFLLRLRALAPAGAVLIGVDLRKPRDILERAYNDAAGYTAAFNKNLLLHANRRLGADFDVDAFEHRAFYAEDLGRIEMHLCSRRDQTVRIGGETVRFRRGETIHTECSYKYTVEAFQKLARGAGFTPQCCWVDAQRLFSLHYLRAPEAAMPSYA
jgi:dimethylhistidine N-methyltransferase